MILLGLLLAIIIADILHEMFPKIYIIFFQIMMGTLVSYLPIFNEFTLNPELFMIIIIKPLIFSEAQRVSIDELKEYRKPILSLSVTLVFVTVFATGLIINSIIPSIPLVITFILVAMIIPTNSGFVKSISHNLNFPKKILPLLEGESLFNDSIAIIIFDFAIAASLKGEFIVSEFLYEFLFMVIGGIISGAILGFIIVRLRLFLIQKNFENPPMMVIIQLLTPFVVYILSEEYLHVSGIIAVIIAGMIHILEKPLLNLKSTKLQIISNNTWDVVDYVLEGFVSVILGVSLPSVMQHLLQENRSVFAYLIFISFLLYIIVLSFRYIWAKFALKNATLKNETTISDTIYKSIFALSGVHGTITLAIALSLPEYIGESNAILSRNELIFISTIVILISLIVPTVIFPMLLHKKDDNNTKFSFENARKEMIAYTISQLQSNITENNRYSINIVLNMLKGQLDALDQSTSLLPESSEVEKILEVTTDIEIESINDMIKSHKISQPMGDFYKKYIKYNNKRKSNFKFTDIIPWLIEQKIKKAYLKNGHNLSDFIKEFNIAKSYASKEVLAYLNQNIDSYGYASTSYVIAYYKEKLSESKNNSATHNYSQFSRIYFSKAFNIEYVFVHDYLESNLISLEVANELKEQISYDKMIYIDKLY